MAAHLHLTTDDVYEVKCDVETQKFSIEELILVLRHKCYADVRRLKTPPCDLCSKQLFAMLVAQIPVICFVTLIGKGLSCCT